MTRTSRLFTRYEHGHLPVDVHEDLHGTQIWRRADLHMGSGTVIEFPSMRAFFQHLYGKNLHVSFDRYFHVLPDMELEGVRTILDYFTVEDDPVEVIRGIDLKARGIEVQKMLYAKFAGRIVGNGYDPKEVLQEVYKKILVQNSGNHPYDPRKSSFGHYVYMVCDSALKNYLKKERRRRSKETSGIAIFEDNERVIVDVGDSQVVGSHQTGLVVDPERRVAEIKAVGALCTRIGDSTETRRLACRIVELSHLGYKRRELARVLKVDSRKVKVAMELVKEEATAWKEEEGIV